MGNVELVQFLTNRLAGENNDVRLRGSMYEKDGMRYLLTRQESLALPLQSFRVSLHAGEPVYTILVDTKQFTH